MNSPQTAQATSAISGEKAKDTSKIVRNEMVAAFELTPSDGVIDEIAILVPNSVIGPFRTEPILPLVRSHEGEKGRTIVFRPKEPIEKWHQFKLSSPMEVGETRIPDVKLCGIDQLKRYVILPGQTTQGKHQRWQTRLLNRENDQAILGNLMSLEAGSQLYRVVGRQWLAIALNSDISNQAPSVSLADIQVRWQKDGSYLASAVFDLKPSGNESCQLIVPHGLVLLDTRITGVPVSPTKLASKTETPVPSVLNPDTFRTPHSTYEISFTSKTLPQRIEVLYRNSEKQIESERRFAPLSSILRKTFQTPFLDAEIQRTRWTVQGPDSYAIRGQFESLQEGEKLSTSLIEEFEEGTTIASLTPYLADQASLGTPVRWISKGFQWEWKTTWRCHSPTPLAEQMPSTFFLLVLGVLVLARPVRFAFYAILHRHRHLFGMAVGIFWWLFLSPSIFGWAIIITFLVVAYRTRTTRLEEDSSVIRIG